MLLPQLQPLVKLTWFICTGLYVDDIDLRDVDMVDMPNYAIGLRAEAGVWVETADKKYRAYIFVNSINAAGTAVISMLRYAL